MQKLNDRGPLATTLEGEVEELRELRGGVISATCAKSHRPRSQAATGPRLTTTNLVVQGIGIFHLVIYLVLESVGCPHLACDTRDDFEYEYRKSGRRFCQTQVYFMRVECEMKGDF